MSDDALLQYYCREWNRFTRAAGYINHLFGYLNRHWVKRELDEGHKNVYDVYTLHLVCWRDYFFMSINNQVMNGVLRAMERHRSGESIDTLLIKGISSSFGMFKTN
jgi:cullin 1